MYVLQWVQDRADLVSIYCHSIWRELQLIHSFSWWKHSSRGFDGRQRGGFDHNLPHGAYNGTGLPVCPLDLDELGVLRWCRS